MVIGDNVAIVLLFLIIITIVISIIGGDWL